MAFLLFCETKSNSTFKAKKSFPVVIMTPEMARGIIIRASTGLFSLPPLDYDRSGRPVFSLDPPRSVLRLFFPIRFSVLSFFPSDPLRPPSPPSSTVLLLLLFVSLAFSCVGGRLLMIFLPSSSSISSSSGKIATCGREAAAEALGALLLPCG